MSSSSSLDGETTVIPLSKSLAWPYQVYNCFTLLLSCLILFCVFVVHQMSRNASVLPHAFQMVTLHKRRMYCFEIDISTGACARKVRIQYMWLLRTAMLVVGCYVWQTCILSYWSIDFADSSGLKSLLSACVEDAADCFGSRVNHAFFSVNADPTNLCTKYEKELYSFIIQSATAGGGSKPSPLTSAATGVSMSLAAFRKEILQDYRYITCINFVKPNTITYTQNLAIAYALGNMIVTLFEMLVWLLYRSKTSLLPVLVLVVGILFLGVWIGSIFIPRLLTFFSSWIGYVMLLSTPLILWTALLAAHNLRRIQHQKWSLWQIQANRPLAVAEDADGEFTKKYGSAAFDGGVRLRHSRSV
ncbi:transmembrane protein [Cystoisospora suis]|uniref:Transmembrane protein n=1 Tax=Cystoisospora suis TaxID=483139 RepID=A0A2C6K2D0_9APIC|nr:transmembrane protein [Cystoisospora suis]